MPSWTCQSCGKCARQDTLISCVYYNSKQRFRLLWLHDSSRSGPTLVLGAVQGHSKAVDYDSVHERVDPSRVPALIHGTHYDFYKKIFKEGLLPGAGNKEWRDQIHLLAASTDLNSKLLPPKCDIVLHIDPALATGCRFYKSANGYYYKICAATACVPAEPFILHSVCIFLHSGFAFFLHSGFGCIFFAFGFWSHSFCILVLCFLAFGFWLFFFAFWFCFFLHSGFGCFFCILTLFLFAFPE